MASTVSNEATYVAMEDGTGLVGLGMRSTPSTYFDGQMAGGPLGPFFMTHSAAGILTADQIKRLYNLGAAALRVNLR